MVWYISHASKKSPESCKVAIHDYGANWSDFIYLDDRGVFFTFLQPIASYLISRGFKVDEDINIIRRYNATSN